MPYSPMHKHCTPVKNLKGKTTGLMMEGSAMHMSMLHQESAKQEKKDLLKDMPVDDKASAMEMSPYKMGHEDSPTEMSPYKMGHEDSPTKMGHESPAKMGHESPAKMGHESPAKFTGMSGGSALHQGWDHDKERKLAKKKDSIKSKEDKDLETMKKLHGLKINFDSGSEKPKEQIKKQITKMQ